MSRREKARRLNDGRDSRGPSHGGVLFLLLPRCGSQFGAHPTSPRVPPIMRYLRATSTRHTSTPPITPSARNTPPAPGSPMRPSCGTPAPPFDCSAPHVHSAVQSATTTAHRLRVPMTYSVNDTQSRWPFTGTLAQTNVKHKQLRIACPQTRPALQPRKQIAPDPEHAAELKRIYAKWSVDASLSDAEFESRAKAYLWQAALLLAATGRPGLLPHARADLLTDPAHKAQLLHGYMRASALFVLLRACPRIDITLLMSYTKFPLPPTLAPGDRDAVGSTSATGETNPWLAIVQNVLHRYSATLAGGAIGASGKRDRNGAETLPGGMPVFVNADLSRLKSATFALTKFVAKEVPSKFAQKMSTKTDSNARAFGPVVYEYFLSRFLFAHIMTLSVDDGSQ
ncbi:hypothetical protein DFH09DRAFT_1076628 [Mycena vulgaris]|nr:hypothetical protein DFH09DRAFT_1076628 [Mycena vulgaris]